MITQEEYEKYVEAIKQEEKINKKHAICWHCKASLQEEQIYGIMKVNQTNTDKHQFVLFHEKCFVEIAGTKYIFKE